MAHTPARADFIRDQRSGRYIGVVVMGRGISWKCQHGHASLDEARECAAAHMADELLDWYDEIKAEEAEEGAA